MKTCSKCSHQQEIGNFCGKCGTNLEEAVDSLNTSTSINLSTVKENATLESAATITENLQNERLGQVKDISKNYINTFLQQLKFPAESVKIESTSIVNSIISIILFSILSAFSIYVLINAKLKDYLGGLTDLFEMQAPSIPLFKTVLTLLVVFLILIAITSIAVFITGKIFSEGASFKRVVEELGAYYSTPIIIAVLNLIFALIGSVTMVAILTLMGLLIVLTVIPSFSIINALNNKTIRIDRFNAYLVYVIIMIVLYYLVGSILYSSFIEGLINTVNSYTGKNNWY